MRAIVITGAGGPDVLELQDVPEPEVGAGQVRVAVEAIGVNFRDVYEREGRYGRRCPPSREPRAPGPCSRPGRA